MAQIRRILGSLWILSSLCSCTEQEHWAFDQIRSGEKDYSSTRLCCNAQDPVNGIDLEMIQAQESLKVYLLVHASPIPRRPDNPKTSSVTLTVDGEKKQFAAYRFEGGQRLQLDSDAVDFLFTSLRAGQTVAIAVPGYRSTIRANDFPSLYAKLQKPFPLPSLIQMPF